MTKFTVLAFGGAENCLWVRWVANVPWRIYSTFLFKWCPHNFIYLNQCEMVNNVSQDKNEPICSSRNVHKTVGRYRGVSWLRHQDMYICSFDTTHGVRWVLKAIWNCVWTFLGAWAAGEGDLSWNASMFSPVIQGHHSAIQLSQQMLDHPINSETKWIY